MDLPDDLAKKFKVLAAQQGRKLKDVVADLLRRGIDSFAEPAFEPSSLLVVDSITGLPTVACRHFARTAERLTPDRVASILLDQEVAWSDEASR